MKCFHTFLLLLALSYSLHAEELISNVSLAEEPLTVAAGSGNKLRPLVEIADPGVSAPVYALKGMLRHEDVEGDGYLQLDNYFGDNGVFFTKSLAATGPLGKISGSSDWRPFVLPFYANRGDQADSASLVPEKLSLSVYLPGAGTVSIRGVGLYQYAIGEDPLRSSGQWFGNRSAGWIGGIGGGLLGLWGALIGVLSARGKARRFALGSATALMLIGFTSVVVGIVAFATDQPYSVYYTLLLLGIIVVAVIGALRRSLSAQYEQIELKRMQAMDV